MAQTDSCNSSDDCSIAEDSGLSSSSSDSSIVKYDDPYKKLSIEMIYYFLATTFALLLIGICLLCWMMEAFRLIKKREEDEEDNIFVQKEIPLKNSV